MAKFIRNVGRQCNFFSFDKNKTNQCDVWMEEAILMLLQWHFKSSDAHLFIKLFSVWFKIMLCHIEMFEKHIYATMITINC